MKIINNKVETMTLSEFADKHDLTLEICKRSDPKLPKYYVSFDNVEIMEMGCLVSTCGNGKTKREAIANYRNSISEKQIAINAFRDNRQNVFVPKLIAG